mgnify:CR=1 FL=1
MSLLKILLIIELIATFSTYFTAALINEAMNNKLKREGYKIIVEESETFLEKLVSFFRDVLECLIPIANIIAPFYFIIAYETMYQEAKQEAIENGEIIKIEEPKQKLIFTSEEACIEDKEKMNYYNMTPEEMIVYLEAEKQKFLKFQELYGNEKIGETLDKINEQTEVQESKPKTYSIGNNSNLKHK